MDTRFWGPSGWRLLHLIVATPLQERKPTDLYRFFELLPYVLPCKFCRHSLSIYYGKRPIPTDPVKMECWLYDIHNEVNNKLRSQRLINTSNPSFEAVHKLYATWASTPCASSQMLGWDFLFSIANTTPSRHSNSSPMEGAPSDLETAAERNKWNAMRYTERQPYIQAWWDLIGSVLPFKPWRQAWSQASLDPAPVSKGRRAVLAWLYIMERRVCTIMAEEAPHNSFDGLCREITAFASGCGKKTSPRVKTCRAKNINARATLRRSRMKRYTQTGGFL